MEQNVHRPEIYDYRQYDRVWQRVAPNLEPYPGMRQSPDSKNSSAEAAPAAAPANSTTMMAPVSQQTSAAQTAQEGQLPGAAQNPCCMGSAAAEMLEVLTGFLEEALSDRRHYLAMARQAPPWARQRLRDIAAGKMEHARHLLAIHYLVTGECYQPAVSCERIYVGRWCPALRERYHAEACNGLNYARAADGTTDPCLVRVLNTMSTEAYHWARELMAMLERGMQSEK